MTAIRRRIISVSLLILVAVATTDYWWQRGRPATVPNAPPDRIACVSYSPYHHPGQSPFKVGTFIPRSQIEHDLAQLAGRVSCVRTYSVGQGLAIVPQVARQYGLKVLLGIWLGRDRAANAREMTLAIKTAQAHPGSIRAIVVGNEVLLRGELPMSELATDIQRVHAATSLPVTYADVWEYWLKYPQLARVVSFITIHILPYWEDHPVAIEDAISHVRSVYTRVQAAIPGKTILIGETGWPSAGRQRGGAVPSRINEARFIRSFLSYARQSDVPYNLVEAYDQPWKRWLEGTAGGNWGLYDVDGNPKFPLQGPVTEDSSWYVGPLSGIALALMLGFATRKVTSRANGWFLTGVVLTGYIGGAVLAAESESLIRSNRDVLEWVLTGSWTLLELLTIYVLATAFGRGLQLSDTMPRNHNVSFGWIARFSGHTETNYPDLLRFVWLFGAAVTNLLLVFDPRYRDFPTALFLPAATGLAVLSLDRDSGLSRTSLETQLLSAWAGASAIVIVFMEGISNRDAIVWGILCIGLGVSVWAPTLRTRQKQHAHHQSHGTRLEAVPDEAGNTDYRGQPRQER